MMIAARMTFDRDLILGQKHRCRIDAAHRLAAVFAMTVHDQLRVCVTEVRHAAAKASACKFGHVGYFLKCFHVRLRVECCDMLGLLAKPINGQRHNITRASKLRRFHPHPHPHTGRGASDDNVAGA